MFDNQTRPREHRLADLQERAAFHERELAEARLSLDQELTERFYQEELLTEADRPPRGSVRAGAAHGPADRDAQDRVPHDRTETMIIQGRAGAAARRGLTFKHKVIGGSVAVVLLVTVMILVLTSGGPGWPTSVATVQNEVNQACQNANVLSEPGQVNFACAKDTRQVLWVFALMNSNDDANYANAKTGRMGLEPITPAQGGEIAWSLNLHHPYSATNPVDSLEVAARAINNIAGGATLTGSNGRPVVESGLESSSANCLRYTGSTALTKHAGFPSLCAQPVSSAAGQAALVSDVYQKWIVGATPQQAQDAALLYTNAQDPGNPQVQAVLKHLSRFYG
ncbi:MAG TPA: hypothetical protein VGH27_21205 [Streptosporangiaceae bacterium]|jgi:hypothetical protein